MNRPARTALTVSTLAVLALGLTACGDDADPQVSPAPATVTVTEEAQTEDPAEDQAGDGQDGQDGQRGDDAGRDGGQARALTAAARTAVEAAGGTLVALDLQADGTWEADVVAQDGAETRVLVSADGAEALDQRADDEADDRSENQQLLTASVDWRTALDTGARELGRAPTELDLGEDDGRLLWEVGTDQGPSVLLDAASGDVVGTDD